jgi:hypothetical protein
MILVKWNGNRTELRGIEFNATNTGESDLFQFKMRVKVVGGLVYEFLLSKAEFIDLINSIENMSELRIDGDMQTRKISIH